jgi:hypothetical protein
VTIKKTILLSIITASVSLVTPFVWMKIGPGGYEYYGPEVPDIYILGATILGKDRSFSGINFAYKFQLAVILYFILSSFLTILWRNNKASIRLFTLINSALLLLFPLWLWMYTEGVICNSDCADLTVYPHIGILLYALLVCLNIMTVIKAGRISLNKKLLASEI